MSRNKEQTGDFPDQTGPEREPGPGESPEDLLADLIADLPLDSGPEDLEEQVKEKEETDPPGELREPAPYIVPGSLPPESGYSSNLLKALAKSGKLPENLAAPIPGRLFQSQLARELRGFCFSEATPPDSGPQPDGHTEPSLTRADHQAEPWSGSEPLPATTDPDQPAQPKQGPRLFMAEPDLYPAMQENLRGCEARLAALHRESKQKVFLFTGQGPGSGVSTVVCNLALVMARDYDGSNILLLDANLARPSLHLAFKRPSNPGLVDIMTRGLKLEDALHTTVCPNLQLLTCGDTSRPSPSPFDRPEMDLLFEQLKFYYDFILIDAAPFTEGNDTPALALKADGVVLIVDYSAESADQTNQDLTRTMQQQGVKVLGTFFIKVDP